MRRLFAGAMTIIAILLGSLNFHCDVFAAEVVNGVTTEIHENTDSALGGDSAMDREGTSDEESMDEGEGSSEEEAEVLGAQREDGSDKFVIFIEGFIGLIFAIGLIAAGKGGYEN